MVFFVLLALFPVILQVVLGFVNHLRIAVRVNNSMQLKFFFKKSKHINHYKSLRIRSKTLHLIHKLVRIGVVTLLETFHRLYV